MVVLRILALSYNERMTTSASTPRIMLTQALYLLVLALVAASDGRSLQGSTALLVQSAGFLVVVMAVLGRLWTTLFIAGKKDQQLVRDGPYSTCRHPLYVCSAIASLGIGLTTRSVVLMVTLPLIVGAIAAVAGRREDAALLKLHGQAWLAYRDAVPAFWPAWSMCRTPDRVSVPPKIYCKAFLDAASFLALWLSVLLIDNLRTGGTWPALFSLP